MLLAGGTLGMIMLLLLVYGANNINRVSHKPVLSKQQLFNFIIITSTTNTANTTTTTKTQTLL